MAFDQLAALGQLAIEHLAPKAKRPPEGGRRSLVVLGVTPPASGYSQAERGAPIRGGMQWRLPVPAGGKARLEYSYRMTFPAKTEIVGGNRRE